MRPGHPSAALHCLRGACRRFGGWLLFAAVACSRSPGKETTKQGSQASLTRSAVPADEVPRPPPRSLFQLNISAYAATLAADDDDESLYVLTSHAAYRLREGEPALHFALELGDTPALSAQGIVYWFDGALRRVPKQGGPSEILVSVSRPPKHLRSTRESVAWVEPNDEGTALLSLQGSEPRSLYRSPGELEALAVMDDRAYFAERTRERWRLGTVALSGGPVRFTEEHATRTPALLAAAGDVFYYDGPSSTVRRVSSGLEREEVVGNDVICSPLAVADRVYCAQVSLLFDLPRDGGPARPLAPKRAGTIAGLVATKKRVTWLLDVGEDRLEVESLPL
ncbi:MAG TPA: hypothetical protein VHP33_36540 [Polyangiaceae bacterium]|nr:hypothetical protein [Polyangiaceae bacterium]